MTTDFDIFLEKCIVVLETQSPGKFSVFLDIDDVFGLDVSFNLTGKLDYIEAEGDPQSDDFAHEFTALDPNEWFGTKKEAEDAMKQLKEAIRKTVEGITNAAATQGDSVQGE